MQRTILLATRNPGKIREIRQVLSGCDVRVAGLEELGLPVPPTPEETGETFADNACQKALYYAQATGEWCLADDSGLVVDALDGAPGVYSARYAADECGLDEDIDEANNRKLLAALAGVPDEKRTARFVCALSLASPKELLLEASGVIEGQIGHHARGDNGFGYDPLFYVPQLGCTTAALPSSRKNALSHRGNALRSFLALYQSRFGAAG